MMCVVAFSDGRFRRPSIHSIGRRLIFFLGPHQRRDHLTHIGARFKEVAKTFFLATFSTAATSFFFFQLYAKPEIGAGLAEV